MRFSRQALAFFATAMIASASPVPDWAADAIWYQIFPERFNNGDPTNDPTRASLEPHTNAPENWAITPWTSAWYHRTDWERSAHNEFYYTVFARRYGGDLQGVIDKLDYLQDLGINAIYFNPIFFADSLHKYDANSFHHIDPHFGPDPKGDLKLIESETDDPATWQWTAADKLFLDLLQQAKQRGMHVILDGVWNHTGVNHFAFRDLVANQGKSRYRLWFKVKSLDFPHTPDQNEFDYDGWHGFKTLPEFSQKYGEFADGPKAYIFNATKRWMDPNGDGDPSDGIDGWRLDVAEELPTQFWKDWHAHVRAINPDAYTSAEIWGDSANFLKENQFSASMNYHGFAFPAKAWFIDRSIDTAEFHAQFQGRQNSHNPDRRHALQNLYDSHDTQRIASAIVNRGLQAGFDDGNLVSPRSNSDYKITPPDETGRAIWKMLALFQMSAPGAPMIYYGTELGMWGADDPDDRMPAWWPRMKFDPMTSGPHGDTVNPPVNVGFDPDIFATFKQLIKLRKTHPVLRHGNYEIFHTQNPDILAFTRNKDSERAFLFFNRGIIPATSPTSRKPIYSTQPIGDDGKIPPNSGALYILEQK